MNAGWWTLIGVGAGTVLGFVAGQGAEWFRRRRRGRAAARLIWSELSRSEALAGQAIEFGPGPPPVVPRFGFWETHAGALAEVAHPDVLIDLEVAYGAAETLGRALLTDGEWDESGEVTWEAWVSQLRDWITAGKGAVEPYAKRRTLRSILGLPDQPLELPEGGRPVGTADAPLD